ncbi:hypothetical protein CCP4SC76_3010035 [Gammaproteobacteria bacterium]
MVGAFWQVGYPLKPRQWNDVFPPLPPGEGLGVRVKHNNILTEKVAFTRQIRLPSPPTPLPEGEGRKPDHLHCRGLSG